MPFHYLQAGQTPLLLAVRKNNMAIVRELVNARVDVDHMYEVCHTELAFRSTFMIMYIPRMDFLL